MNEMKSYAYALTQGEINDVIAQRNSSGDITSPGYLSGSRARIARRFQTICLSAIERVMMQMPQHIRCRIGFGFLDNNNAGAFSARSLETPIIVIHDIMIPLIYVFFCRMLKMNGQLIHHHTGDMDKGSRFWENTDALWAEAEEFPSENVSFRWNVLLWDRIQISLSYIVYHELAHVLRGHSRNSSRKSIVAWSYFKNRTRGASIC